MFESLYSVGDCSALWQDKYVEIDARVLHFDSFSLAMI